ncbi:30S ribosomal protein S12 methylthiotransferase RimO [Thermosediminibacter oceani]|uniref:Ribosomal protein uS12 methylthiotransferase RimO n=1 Tax=Thermosediminibacter oceani (strain ATCC BAA-1034 / DSM 16646 / JW/IW-1228P) TaxID=555079 RepID=D9S3K1_THEOJ|nr:30S ribosomal protein S12 methylthiotransferase RimO [Thermosediminibacter oceani]ADL07978.1 SSU ribosomal protein S12P methylthiotransferase [Thermosediminibacter oceani DSM 16646]
MKEKIGLVSLGCDKNLVDSEYLLGALLENGYVITSDASEADIIIINTCCFINSAKQESIDTILEMAQYKTSGNCKMLIATGCLAQRYGDAILKEIPELDAVIGTGDFHKLPGLIEKLNNSRLKIITENRSFINYDIKKRVRTSNYFSYVKIAEGCSNCCSYCAIPQIRGPYKSRPIESIKEEVELLVSQGVKEINLVAQDTTSYGMDISGKPSLPDLLRALVDIKGEFWIRILYAYPTHIDDELLELISSSTKIAKYLDIPLQHINDRILRLMNRPINSEQIKKLIEKIRIIVPDITIRTTFIVGFPTESDSDFQELIDFVKIYRFDRVGAFKYSREEGTYAATLKPQVPERVKQERYDQLMTVQQVISKMNNEKMLGSTITVLAESYDPARKMFIGRSQKDAPGVDGTVMFQGEVRQLGRFYRVKITEAFEYDLMGEVVE